MRQLMRVLIAGCSRIESSIVSHGMRVTMLGEFHVIVVRVVVMTKP